MNKKKKNNGSLPLHPHLPRDLLRDLQKRIPSRAPLIPFLRNDGRHAPVRVLADPRVQRDVAEEVDPETGTFREDAPVLVLPIMAIIMVVGKMFPPGEDPRLRSAMRTREKRHVPHHAQHGDVGALEQTDPAHRVAQGDVLRRRHDHGTVEDDLLGYRQLDVAGAGGEVEDEDVERTPGDGVEELVHGFGDHEAAPGDGGWVHGLALSCAGV